MEDSLEARKLVVRNLPNVGIECEQGLNQHSVLSSMIATVSKAITDVLMRNVTIDKTNAKLRDMIRDIVNGKDVRIPASLRSDLVKEWAGARDYEEVVRNLKEELEADIARQEKFKNDLQNHQAEHIDEYERDVFGHASLTLLERLVEELPRLHASDDPFTAPYVPPFTSKLHGDRVHVPNVGAVSQSSLDSIARFLRNDNCNVSDPQGIWDLTATMDVAADDFEVKCKGLCEFMEEHFLSASSGIACASVDVPSTSASRFEVPYGQGMFNDFDKQDHMQSKRPTHARDSPASNWSSQHRLESRPLGGPLGFGFPSPSRAVVTQNEAQQTGSSEEKYSSDTPPFPSDLVPSMAQSVGLPTQFHSAAILRNHSVDEPQSTEPVTLHLRNIPTRLTVNDLMCIWPPQDSYNLVYVPYSHEHRRTIGCAVINFLSPDAANTFYEQWQGARLTTETGTKPLEIQTATTQGLASNLWFMKNSKKISRIRNPRYQPTIIRLDGTIADFKQVIDSMVSPTDVPIELGYA